MAHRFTYTEISTYRPSPTREESIDFAKWIFELTADQVNTLRETGSCRTSRGVIKMEEVPDAKSGS